MSFRRDFPTFFLAGTAILVAAAVTALWCASTNALPPGMAVLGLGGALTLFAASLVLPGFWKLQMALVAGSLAVCVWLAELKLVWTAPPTLQEAAGKAGKNFDRRSRFELVKDLRRKGVDAQLSISPVFFLETDGLTNNLYPLGGISRKTTVGNNESGEYCIYKADEHGFNNPPGLWEFPDLQAVLIGDSFTHGHHVSPGQDIAGWLRNKGLSTLNLGMAGNGPYEELATLVEFATPLRPAFIFWMYYEGNDLSDLNRSANSALLKRYLDPSFRQNLQQRQPEVDEALLVYGQKAELTHAGTRPDKTHWSSGPWKFAKLTSLRGTISSWEKERSRHKGEGQAVRGLSRILKRAKSEAETAQARFIFVYLPEWSRYASSHRDEDSFRHRGAVLQTVQELDIPIVDLHPVFARQKDPLKLFPFRANGHYTPEGYRLVAQTVRSELDRITGPAQFTRRSTPQ